MACAQSTFPASASVCSVPAICGTTDTQRTPSVSATAAELQRKARGQSSIRRLLGAPSSQQTMLRAASMLQPPALSLRGQHHGSKVTPFWDVFERIIGNAYCHETNKEGICNLAISNNYLMEPELLRFFSTNLQLVPTDLTYGTSLFGSHRLFAALCQHFNSSVFHPIRAVEPQHLITGPGCGPLLDQVFEHLCDPDDAVLIAAPYYNGYDADLSCRSRVHCIAVHSGSDDGCGPSSFEGPSALRGFAEAKEAWQKAHPGKVRAIIICNPHNPVGRCYDRDALLVYGRFAEEHDLHLVFDEIFAMSTFSPAVEGEEMVATLPFHSALSIDWSVEASCHPARVHVVWSASKDFGCNGLRLGTVISQANPELLRAMKATAKLYMVSSAADALFSALLCNPAVYDDFIATNSARMAQAYEIVARWCGHHAIEYTPCRAGHFILVDLERFMPSEIDGQPVEGTAREGALWARLLEHAVCITPGSNYHHPHLGTFRLIFTLRRPALLEGLARIERALGLAPWITAETLPCCTAPEAIMQSLEEAPIVRHSMRRAADAGDHGLAPEAAAKPASPHCSTPPPDAELADTQRRQYASVVREMLKEGANKDGLEACGVGLPCAC